MATPSTHNLCLELLIRNLNGVLQFLCVKSYVKKLMMHV